jgi:hypothetical protein
MKEKFSISGRKIESENGFLYELGRNFFPVMKIFIGNPFDCFFYRFTFGDQFIHTCFTFAKIDYVPNPVYLTFYLVEIQLNENDKLFGCIPQY